MTETEELEKMRNILYNLGLAQIKAQKDNGKTLQKMLNEIRYGYVYNLMNSVEGEPAYKAEQRRIESLNRLENILGEDEVGEVIETSQPFPGFLGFTALKG